MATAITTGTFHGEFPLYGTELVIVTFAWSTRLGSCYECGLPAQFFLPRAYINEQRTPNAPDQAPDDTNKRCAICAANAAAEGEPVLRIEPEVEES